MRTQLDLSPFIEALAEGRPISLPGSRPWGPDEVARYLTSLDESLGSRLGEGAFVVTEEPSTVPSILDILWCLSSGRSVRLDYQSVPRWVPPAQRNPEALQFSLSFFANDEDDLEGPKYRLLLDGARLADQLGFAAIWTPERHFHAFGGLYPSPAVVSSALAAITSRLSIRAGSVVMPLHDPIRAAEEWSIIDNISGGRVGVSFASGWHANDFVLAPEHYAQRKQVMLERIDVVRRLWRGEPVERRNGAGEAVKVAIRPRPVQPELPFWLTAAGSPETFRLAGELGGFVLTNLMGQALDDLATKIGIYRQAWRAAGHGPGDGHVTLMLHAFLAESEELAYAQAREPLLRYFRSSIDITRGFATSQGIDVRPEDLSEADLQTLLEHGLERYLHDGGLFGTPERCVEMVDRLHGVGIDEVAALIDFGVPVEPTLASVKLLGQLVQREATRSRAAASAGHLAGFAQSLRAHKIADKIAAIQGSPDLFAWLREEAPDALEGVALLGADLVRHTLPDGGWITAWADRDGAVRPALDVEVVDAQGKPLGAGIVGDLVLPGSPPTGQRARWRADGRLDLLPPRPSRPQPPLSYAQQRLWSLDHLMPGDIAYNNPVALRMRGPLNVSALHRALQEVVRRHEILRTTFATTVQGAVQVIHSSLELDLPVVEAQAADVGRLAREYGRRPFDLTRGPLLRVCLLRLASDMEYVLLVSMHHIVSDGWSAGVLFTELGMLYAAFAASEPSPLPPLPMQYAEYAIRQREHSPLVESELDYWKVALADVPVLELPLDRPRRPVQGHEGALCPVTIDRGLTDAVRLLCRSAGVTPFMVLMAAFVTVLHRYSGQTDLAIGTAVAGRNRPEFEPLVGVFVNSVVVRTDASGDPTFRDLLSRVKTAALGAFAHQEVPFERLVDELKVPRDLSLSPLFQAMLLLNNTPSPRVELGEVTLEGLDIDLGVARLDLMLELQEGPDGISGAWEYNTDLFDVATLQQLTHHLMNLLTDAVAQPDRRLSELALLSDVERSEILALSAGEPLAMSRTAQTVSEAFEEQVARTPSAIALGSNSFTYRELNGLANMLAHGLREKGVGPGTRVALVLERPNEMIAAMLGVLKAGGAYVPLDPHAPPARREELLRQAEPIVILSSLDLASGRPDSNLDVLSGPSDAAYVIFTSGSTGQAKGVVVEHRQLLYSTWARVAYYGEPAGKCVAPYPLNFDASVGWIYYTLLSGGTLWCPRSTDPRELASLVRDVAADRFSSVPAMYREVLGAAQPGQLASLRSVSVIGERCAPEVARAHFETLPDVEFHNEYGPTETTVWSTVHPVTPPVTGEIPIGRPLPSTLAFVLDRNGHLLPVGAPGELYLGGPGVARGYLGQDSLTSQRFVPDRLTDSGRLYRTGDLVRWRRDGTLEFLGRIDRQVKVRGFRVEPAEVEATLAAHPAVVEAAVVPVSGPHTTRLVGYIAGSDVDVDEVRSFAQSRLPDYLVPAMLVALPALPRTANGKVDVAALPSPTPVAASSFVEPRNDRERALASLIAEVLGAASVGIHDNFFDIGGDSILAITVVTRARNLGIEFQVRQVFQHPTVAGLAAAARIGTPDGPRPMVTGRAPLAPSQQRFFDWDLPEPDHWNGGLQLELTEQVHHDALQQAFRAVLNHHDAFGLRFVRDADGWQQQHAPAGSGWTLDRIDLSAESPGGLPPQADRLQASLNLAHGPLMRAATVHYGPGQPQRLLIGAHHLAIDGVSWRIILEDLFTAYRQLRHGSSPQLPPPTTSYLTWASALPEFTGSEQGKAELAYWTGLPYHLAARVPGVGDVPTIEATTRVLRANLGQEETRILLSGDVEAALFSALASALAAWTGSDHVRLDRQRHGREDLMPGIDLTRTVGWIADQHPLVLPVPAAASPAQRLTEVADYLRNVPQHGAGYGPLRYLAKDSPLRAIPRADVVLNYQGRLDSVIPPDAPARIIDELPGRLRASSSPRPYPLGIMAAVFEGRLWMSWSYSEGMHERETIERVAGNAIEHLRELTRSR